MRSKISPAHFGERRAAFENAPGIDVHVFLQPPVGFRICANLDDGGNRGPDDRTPAGGEERNVRAARDEFPDFLNIADIGESPAHLPIRDHIQEIQARRGGRVAGREDAA